MALHEYQTKALLKEYGVPVPPSQTVITAEEAYKAALALSGNVWAVKAQVLAGGRGKAGGIKIVSTPEDVKKAATELLGKTLVTKQTGQRGEKIQKILIEQGSSIEKEFYLSLLVDTSSDRVIFMASPDGGMDIEEVAEKTPERIYKESVHPAIGVQSYQAWSLGRAMGFQEKDKVSKLFNILTGLYKLFIEKDMNLLEINPLILNSKGDFIALDGKATLDENAFYRQKELVGSLDPGPLDKGEALAKSCNLAYIKLEGSIGCMVNGAGLAMATMDIINFHGGQPANFLDVGGGAEEDKVIKAFEIIMQASGIKVILVNIFGGIMHCDVIASGLIKAVKKMNLNLPVVVRLEGTRSKEGVQMLRESSLQLIPANSLDEAALKAVKLAKET